MSYAQSVQKKRIDLTLSVNPLGCSPRVKTLLETLSIRTISDYPDSSRLVQNIAASFDIKPTSILLGNGSEQLIKLICQTFLRQSDTVFVENGSFFLFSKESMLKNAPVTFFSPDTLKMPDKPIRLLFLANPTTPGGVKRSNKKIGAILTTLKPAVAVIDEANGEFCDETFVRQLKKRTNVIILRTFSKAYGLAGLRIGFAIGNEKLIQILSQSQQPFPVSSISILAAETALTDTAFIEKTKRYIASERRQLTDGLVALGCTVSDSVTNNLYISCPRSADVVRTLASKNISVIDGSYFPGNILPGFRISIKDKRTNRIFLQTMQKILACHTQDNLIGSKEIV